MVWVDRWAVASAFSSTLLLPQALQKGLEALGDEFPAEGVFANTFVAETSEVWFLAHATRRDARELSDVAAVPAGVRPLPATHPDGVTVVEDIAQDPFTRTAAGKVIAGIRSFILISLQIEERHLGVVCFYSTRPGAFHDREARAVSWLRTLLSLQVGFALGIRLDRRSRRIESINRELMQTLALAKSSPLAELVRRSPSMRMLAPLIKQAAGYPVPVLITGESGTGKEVLATAIHNMSSRAMRPFVRVNCAAIPEALIEAELFGYEAGAFTDARRMRRGLFEEADGGTIFLDEIGELPLAMQGKLLHVLQNQAIRRVGGTVEIPINVRIISATNRSLSELVDKKLFRLDLYYRLNVLRLHIPPLRERPEDFEPLIALFAQEVKERFHVPLPENFVPALLADARAWRWPGNVRELRNAVIRSGLSAQGSAHGVRLVLDDGSQGAAPDAAAGAARIKAAPPAPEGEAQAQAQARPPAASCLEAVDFETMQRQYFSRLLDLTEGRISGAHGAARLAGMNPNTMRSRLIKLGLLGEARQPAAPDPGCGRRE